MNATEMRPDQAQRITAVFSVDAVFLGAYDEKIGEESFKNMLIVSQPGAGSYKNKTIHYSPLPFFPETCAWLIAQDMRIVFYGWKYKHDYQKLIDSYFTSLLTAEKYEALKKQGQFQVFWGQTYNAGPAETCWRFTLEKIGLTKQNAVLIVEDSSLIDDKKEPFIFLKDRSAYHSSLKEFYPDYLPYVVGLMKRIQRQMGHNDASFYEAMRTILPKNQGDTFDFDVFNHIVFNIPFVMAMRECGCHVLNEFYEMDLSIQSYPHTFMERPFDVIMGMPRARIKNARRDLS